MGIFRHFSRLRRMLSLACGVGVIFLSSCAYRPMPMIKLAVNHWPGYEFLFLAKEKHYFEKEGVHVQLVEFTSLPDAMEAYKAGDVDGMACTMIETLLAAEQSPRQPQVFLVADYSNGGDVILARDPIQQPGELAGREVACESAHLGGYLLTRALKQHGLALGDVQIHNIDQAAMEKAFRQGEVDALVTYPPVSTRLQRDTNAHVIFSSADIPHEILDVVVADKTVIEKNPDAIRALSRAWGLAHTFHQTHREEAHQIMGRRIGLKPEEFALTLEDVQLVLPDEQMEYFGPNGQVLEVARHTHDILHQMGAIKKDMLVSAFIAPASLQVQP